MIFQCNDLERALRTPELMPDMRAHAAQCEACGRQLYIWNEISRLAPELHREWESPLLWQRIRSALAAEVLPPRPSAAFWAPWRWILAAAAVALFAVWLSQPWPGGGPRDLFTHDLLTETALQEVQQTEAAYTHSIDRLSALAAAGLQQSPSPLAAAYREKLVLLDSAIADLKANAENNRYNAYLQVELASLYRAKQNTLQGWLTQNAKRN
jgi:hypothetical protein